jgi:hypothetical protein
VLKPPGCGPPPAKTSRPVFFSPSRSAGLPQFSDGMLPGSLHGWIDTSAATDVVDRRGTVAASNPDGPVKKVDGRFGAYLKLPAEGYQELHDKFEGWSKRFSRGLISKRRSPCSYHRSPATGGTPAISQKT